MRRKAVRIALLLMLCVFLCCGCIGMDKTETAAEGHSFSDAEIMLVIASERNRYREVYTDQVWQVQVEQSGTTFEEYLLGEIRHFMTELTVMSRMAESCGVRLTGQEKEKMKQLAGAYYKTLTRADRKYTGAKEKDVRSFYEQYLLANKLVDELTKDVDLEISDSEAKVIRVQEIVVHDAQTAADVLEKVNAERADFLSIARSVSEDARVEKQVGRNERPAEYETVVFALETGQISPVIESDGAWYIVRVTMDYDEDATQERKEKLMKQRRNRAFGERYDAFCAEYPTELSGDIWTVETLRKGEDSSTTSLFEAYREFMDS